MKLNLGVDPFARNIPLNFALDFCGFKRGMVYAGHMGSYHTGHGGGGGGRRYGGKHKGGMFGGGKWK